jgi:hypothetical protein
LESPELPADVLDNAPRLLYTQYQQVALRHQGI